MLFSSLNNKHILGKHREHTAEHIHGKVFHFKCTLVSPPPPRLFPPNPLANKSHFNPRHAISVEGGKRARQRRLVHYSHRTRRAQPPQRAEHHHMMISISISIISSSSSHHIVISGVQSDVYLINPMLFALLRRDATPSFASRVEAARSHLSRETVVECTLYTNRGQIEKRSASSLTNGERSEQYWRNFSTVFDAYIESDACILQL